MMRMTKSSFHQIIRNVIKDTANYPSDTEINDIRAIERIQANSDTFIYIRKYTNGIITISCNEYILKIINN